MGLRNAVTPPNSVVLKHPCLIPALGAIHSRVTCSENSNVFTKLGLNPVGNNIKDTWHFHEAFEFSAPYVMIRCLIFCPLSRFSNDCLCEETG